MPCLLHTVRVTVVQRTGKKLYNRRVVNTNVCDNYMPNTKETYALPKLLSHIWFLRSTHCVPTHSGTAHLPVFTRLAFRLKLGIIGCPLMRPMLRDGSPYTVVHVLQPELHRFTSSDRRRIESNTINQLGCRVADVVGRVVVRHGLGPLSGLSAVTCRV